jgi:ABC-type lipoprotein release transport system permease subunit
MSEITDAYTSGKVKIGELERKKKWEIEYLLERDGWFHVADACRAQALVDEGYQLVAAQVVRFSPAEEREVAEFNRRLDKARHLSKRAKKVRQRRKNWKRMMRLYRQMGNNAR